ncbi:MAG: hypothetical protein WBC44_18790 [Planctomycetaceae bacterium]
MIRTGIVSDGAERWRAGTIRAEVIPEYAERFHKANGWRRLLLRLEVERVVSRRLRDVMPPSPESLF